MSWELDLDGACWDSSLSETSPVVCCGVRAHVCWVKWNSQYSKNCVSLSSCQKSKLKEGNKSFVAEPRESSVFRVYFGIPMRMNIMNILWTYVYFTYMSMLHILFGAGGQGMPIMAWYSNLGVASEFVDCGVRTRVGWVSELKAEQSA